MQKTKAYDLPTRAFHLLFGILFITSFSIGKFVDDDSWLYAYHMLSGLVMAFMVILRIIWGFTGTQYARFSSFKLSPKELVDYFLSVIKGKTKREIGHNPASSYAAVGMFVLTFALVTSGLLMVNGIFKELVEEVHELFAFGFLLLVLSHIAGVVLHQFRHRDGMIFSMFTGLKTEVENQSGIKSNAPIAFVLFLILIVSFAGNLLANFNVDAGTLTVFGKTLQLGEKENEHDAEHYNKYYDKEDDDHDDD